MFTSSQGGVQILSATAKVRIASWNLLADVHAKTPEALAMSPPHIISKNLVNIVFFLDLRAVGVLRLCVLGRFRFWRVSACSIRRLLEGARAGAVLQKKK